MSSGYTTIVHYDNESYKLIFEKKPTFNLFFGKLRESRLISRKIKNEYYLNFYYVDHTGTYHIRNNSDFEYATDIFNEELEIIIVKDSWFTFPYLKKNSTYLTLLSLILMILLFISIYCICDLYNGKLEIYKWLSFGIILLCEIIFCTMTVEKVNVFEKQTKEMKNLRILQKYHINMKSNDIKDLF